MKRPASGIAVALSAAVKNHRALLLVSALLAAGCPASTTTIDAEDLPMAPADQATPSDLGTPADLTLPLDGKTRRGR
jgi:hypothetical protein